MSERYGQSICEELLDERHRQDEKWGEQNHSPEIYFAILSEEVGESAKEVVEARAAKSDAKRDLHLAKLRAELVQSGAVVIAMIQCLDRQRFNEEAARS